MTFASDGRWRGRFEGLVEGAVDRAEVDLMIIGGLERRHAVSSTRKCSMIMARLLRPCSAQPRSEGRASLVSGLGAGSGGGGEGDGDHQAAARGGGRARACRRVPGRPRRTMDSPRPNPRVTGGPFRVQPAERQEHRLDLVAGHHRPGVAARSGWPGRRPRAVVTASQPPSSTLCRTAFSTRFCTQPFQQHRVADGTGRGQRAVTSSRRRTGRSAPRRVAATSARSTSVRSASSFSESARVSRPSISRSCRVVDRQQRLAELPQLVRRRPGG